MSALKKEDLIGKIVINANGNSLGKVVDIGISVTGMGVLKVETRDGRVQDIEMSEVQAIGEYILLKPSAAPRVPQPLGPQPSPGQPAPPPPYPSRQQGFSLSRLLGLGRQQQTPPPPAAPPSYPPAPAPPASGPVICPHCRFTNPPGSRFCQNCGAQLS